MTKSSQPPKPRFCSECGTQLLPDARFCQSCGAPVEGRSVNGEPAPALSLMMRWGIPAAAIVALIAISLFRLGTRSPVAESGAATPPGAAAMRAPDISAMSPSERADRLFNRVMSLASEGKADSVAFFAPMAIAAFEALAPLNPHSRYDMGLVALVSGDVARAAAQSDSILRERPTHLLGLALAARVADARGDLQAGRAARQRLLAAEKAERAAALPEYRDHDADLRAAIDSARSR